jgi:predicted small lipoprotein YifL
MFKNICWVNWLFAVMLGALALVSISSLLTGCGNKGDLTLPTSATDTSNTADTTPVIQKKN